MANQIPVLNIPSPSDFLAISSQTRAEWEADPEKRIALEGNPHGNPMQIGQALPPTEEWVDDMVTGARNNAPRWKKNSLRPKKDPIQAAIAAEPKYVQKMQEVIANGTRAKALASVTLQDVAHGIETGGDQRYLSGVEKGKPKALKKIAKLREFMLSTQGAIDGMPTDSPGARDAKVLANLNRMRAAKTAVIS